MTVEKNPEQETWINKFTIVHCLFGVFFGWFTSWPLWIPILIHILFEIGENMFPHHFNSRFWQACQPFLAKFNLTWGPANNTRQYKGDDPVNTNMDTLFFIMGTLIGRFLLRQGIFRNCFAS